MSLKQLQKLKLKGDHGSHPIGPPQPNPTVGEYGTKERCNPALTMWRSAVLLEQDVCYLSVLLQLWYKEQFQHV
jgi:hypothetical protein